MTCNWDIAFWQWAVYVAPELIVFDCALLRFRGPDSAKHHQNVTEPSQFSRFQSSFVFQWGPPGTSFEPAVALKVMDGAIRCTLTLGFSLYHFGIFPCLFVYHLHYPSVQSKGWFSSCSHIQGDWLNSHVHKLCTNICNCSHRNVKLLGDAYSLRHRQCWSIIFFHLSYSLWSMFSVMHTTIPYKTVT